jgi:hypothetical protein
VRDVFFRLAHAKLRSDLVPTGLAKHIVTTDTLLVFSLGHPTT